MQIKLNMRQDITDSIISIKDALNCTMKKSQYQPEFKTLVSIRCIVQSIKREKKNWHTTHSEKT